MPLFSLALVVLGAAAGAVGVRRVLPAWGWRKQLAAAAALPVLFLCLHWKFESAAQVAFFAAFSFFLYLAVLWDLREKIIPDWISIGGTVAGVALSIVLVGDDWFMPILGILVAGGLMLVVALVRYGKLGGGDIKLAAMMGAFLGPQPALISILFSAITGFLVGAVLIGFGRLEKDATVPYGPFLLAGALLGIFLIF